MNIPTHPLLVLASLLAAGAFTASTSMAVPAGRQLHGKVGPGFTILLEQDGKPVTSLRPGTYWLTVEDLSGVHNFHILGPGLDDVVTSVPFTGTVTHKIHLRHGGYTFQCDPHSFAMFGTFTVGGRGQD
jgi:hypothetical protein